MRSASASRSLGFTVGGMHPPVVVAADYQAVVSAELGKVTAVVNAQAFRNRTVPLAEDGGPRRRERARAREGADDARAGRRRSVELSHAAVAVPRRARRSTSSGGASRRSRRAWPARRFTVVDARFQRDGGELWVTP